ncbi:hypothetical protein B0H10DRAFT_2234926 [Mycena sp. CBHHK59/15]|nr:hypothetical protein B0H10DRAFT_2234926 [Mycena sp. CBHHK59/15]
MCLAEQKQVLTCNNGDALSLSVTLCHSPRPALSYYLANPRPASSVDARPLLPPPSDNEQAGVQSYLLGVIRMHAVLSATAEPFIFMSHPLIFYFASPANQPSPGVLLLPPQRPTPLHRHTRPPTYPKFASPSAHVAGHRGLPLPHLEHVWLGSPPSVPPSSASSSVAQTGMSSPAWTTCTAPLRLSYAFAPELYGHQVQTPIRRRYAVVGHCANGGVPASIRPAPQQHPLLRPSRPPSASSTSAATAAASACPSSARPSHDKRMQLVPLAYQLYPPTRRLAAACTRQSVNHRTVPMAVGVEAEAQASGGRTSRDVSSERRGQREVKPKVWMSQYSVPGRRMSFHERMGPARLSSDLFAYAASTMFADEPHRPGIDGRRHELNRIESVLLLHFSTSRTGLRLTAICTPTSALPPYWPRAPPVVSDVGKKCSSRRPLTNARLFIGAARTARPPRPHDDVLDCVAPGASTYSTASASRNSP